ncbi:GMC oxidoreductase [Phanerochaete sordida]|uniref:GMC oxidoreductase n=1 Tax=Phanerochaete sordida TaxID=48140 RepID=A0A9P3G8N3_9APHY|nr:GMC oxidoreductase [Phanerochaete sordida]
MARPLALCAALALLALPHLGHATIVTSTPPNGMHFDFVVICGGTAGFALAARLSAHPGISVLTIEAGRDNRTDAATQSMLEFGTVLDGPLDWSCATAEGRTIDGGKTLGGSSSINGAAWTRGQDAQYDAWNALLESEERAVGWGWSGDSGLLHYMQKSLVIRAGRARLRRACAGCVHGRDAHAEQRVRCGPQAERVRRDVQERAGL